VEEGEMDVVVALVAHVEAAEVGEPGRVRSTTQRTRPSRSLLSMPMRAMQSLMPRRRK